MGCYSTAFPGGREIDAESARDLGELWGFDVPDSPGRTAPEMIDAAAAGELDLLFAVGGNFVDVLPDPERTAETLGRVPLRVHMDITLSSQMLVPPAEGGRVLLLPATTRYEVPGGVTETSTERRVILSPEVEGPRITEARPEWRVLGDLAARVRPELAEAVSFPGTPEIRDEIARVVPAYAGIAGLREGGDSFQYGGRLLCDGEAFPTADGCAHFAVVPLPEPPPDDGRFALSTRRGKQFNSMVQEHKDALTGARREAVLVAAADLERLGLSDGAEVTLRSDFGELEAVLVTAPIAPGNVQVHWPEGNVLIGPARSPESGIPDYNARVTIEAV
jgi:predicted molibdopterin-dependent oxidoreductase YjgC